MSQAHATTDHDEIRRWIEDRGGRPTRVAASRGKRGIVRVDFGEADEELEEISWDEFFTIFDESELAFLCQDRTTNGETSRFNKFISRDR